MNKSESVNLCITTNCNKNCSFCFAEKSNKEMSLDFVKKLIDKFPEIKNVQILGGEPTIAKNFSEIINFLKSKRKKIKVISNFLFDSDLEDKLFHMLPRGTAILVNAMELDKDNRKENFIRNYNNFIKKFNINLSFTIAQYHTKEYFEKYCDFLINNNISDKFIGIRIGLDLSGKYLINNKQISTIIKTIADKMYHNRRNGEIFFDCLIPDCIFEYNQDNTIKGLEKYILNNPHKSFNEFFNNKFYSNNLSCCVPPFDILPSGEVFYCYQTKDKFKIENIFEYNSILDAKSILKDHYLNYSDNHIQINNECIECQYFKKKCWGLCLSCS